MCVKSIISPVSVFGYLVSGSNKDKESPRAILREKKNYIMAINSEQLNSLFYSVLLFETPRRDENKSCTLMKRPVLLHRMAIFKEDFSLSLSRGQCDP